MLSEFIIILYIQTSDGNTQRAGDDFRVTGGEIVVGHLVGLTALVHNESSLGFFKRRSCQLVEL